MYSKRKGGRTEYASFATINLKSKCSVYLSAYGRLASALLGKYVAGQRADNEELFAEWDKSIQKASSQAGFSTTHEVEDGYLYINTFQTGIGVTIQDEVTQKKGTARGRTRDVRASLATSGLVKEVDKMEDKDG